MEEALRPAGRRASFGKKSGRLDLNRAISDHRSRATRASAAVALRSAPREQRERSASTSTGAPVRFVLHFPPTASFILFTSVVWRRPRPDGVNANRKRRLLEQRGIGVWGEAT